MQAGLTKLLAIATLACFSLGIQAPKVQAKAKQLAFEVPIESQIAYRDLIQTVESSAQAEISQQFRNHPEISTLQISVLVERNGEIIPMFAVNVSRTQWGQQPRIRQWAKYHNSYALLKRHDSSEAGTAIASSGPTSSTPAILSRGIDAGYDSAFDRGSLSSRVAQSSLDYWD